MAYLLSTDTANWIETQRRQSDAVGSRRRGWVLPRGSAAVAEAWKFTLEGTTLTITDAVISYGGRTYVHPSAQVTVHPADLVWCDWSIIEHRFSFVAGDPEEGTVYTEDGNQVYECEVPLQSGLNHRIWLCEMDPNGQIGRDFIHGAFCPFLYDTRTAAEVPELPVED